MTKRVRGILVVVFSVWCLWLLIVSVEASERATLVVTKSADTDDGVCDSDCSIREAVAAANADFAHDTIDFSMISTSYFTLPLGTLFIESDVTFNCGLPTLTTSLDGLNSIRIFFVTPGNKLDP